MKKITHAQVLEYFEYNPQNGNLIWKRNQGRARKGMHAGTPNSGGHIRIRIFTRFYYAHQLIWFYVTGKWPLNDIDHKDLDPGNNRWGNLREATRSQNIMNTRIRMDNTSGVRGVCFHKTHKLWFSYIETDGNRKYLGWFKKFDDAVNARRSAELEWGQFRYQTGTRMTTTQQKEVKT